MTLHYRCPICSAPLAEQNKTLRCEHNHQFDVAKEGYVNLLPVQFKNSRQPGDNLDMVQARRAFFATEHYQFLQTHLAHTISAMPCESVIDMGCGEGFYTQAIASALPECSQVFGVDISKPAIRYAAKRYPQVRFSVASIKDAPFSAEQADVLLSVFAPVFAEEMARLLKPEGQLLVVSPGPKHLYELKQHIYDDVRLHDVPDCPSGFVEVEQRHLEQTQQVATEVVKHLIKMTPFAWKFKESHYQTLEQTPTHQVTFSFLVTRYQKS
ncbi:23S rRNA (guanine(745)-N(1))-methyltransferase [Pseudoalteromonas rubra]|uniref:23S rRNA (Guanine(745)-N(1))-methyltransferase n=1 Tax=Pseudoalteromonas rubra TaxID=43658 RepID=A0A5S3WM47_9GAMM|nr:23S rRNA (guanine(745)-N(1))-methyltransferase [Pseudoalteromonas rubra]TMP29060.1 23S rRNA (guanine(745)-N(1))-methyltransferase [Pseudoalteromonas rubra]TMP33575.1 23S rRNA (guanine(745)-N(1))-methyltransferase [Pseudoalteromonas rubra]